MTGYYPINNSKPFHVTTVFRFQRWAIVMCVKCVVELSATVTYAWVFLLLRNGTTGQCAWCLSSSAACLSVCLSVSLPIHLSVCPSVCLSVHPSIWVSVLLSVGLSHSSSLHSTDWPLSPVSVFSPATPLSCFISVRYASLSSMAFITTNQNKAS